MMVEHFEISHRINQEKKADASIQLLDRQKL